MPSNHGATDGVRIFSDWSTRAIAYIMRLPWLLQNGAPRRVQRRSKTTAYLLREYPPKASVAQSAATRWPNWSALENVQELCAFLESECWAFSWTKFCHDDYCGCLWLTSRIARSTNCRFWGLSPTRRTLYGQKFLPKGI